ncbi:hypothetical protein B0A55_06226 [Friedmanniomyces simplex]|uniref:Uncharacterized protein n=1 Tax=Friedmanniomyces simplex TaxID=329884 RepID=A0A4U0X2Q0_9PEZI|nr:hypothetical protein B0A55_06226 [Friedmanniomyces simplex]
MVRELTGGDVEKLRRGSPDAVTITPASTTTKVTKKLKTARANTRVLSDLNITHAKGPELDGITFGVASYEDDDDYEDWPTEPVAKKIKAVHSFEELVGSEDSDTDGEDAEVELGNGWMAVDALETAAETSNDSLGNAQYKTQARMLTEQYDYDEEE